MASKVVFTKKTNYDFENILNYIKNEFGSLTAIRFKDLVIEFATYYNLFQK